MEFEPSPLGTLFLVVVALIVLLHAGSVAWKVWLIRREGDEAWTRRGEADAIDTGGLEEAAFKRAYFRAYGPRGALHFYAGAGIALVLTYPALAILGEIWELFWRLSGEPRAYAPNTLIWQFFIFFSAPAFWAAITHAALRRYHRNRPRELRKEIAREKADALTPASSPPSH